MKIKDVIKLLDEREQEIELYGRTRDKDVVPMMIKNMQEDFCKRRINMVMQQCTPAIYDEKFREDLKRCLMKCGADKVDCQQMAYHMFYNKLVDLEKKLEYLEK